VKRSANPARVVIWQPLPIGLRVPLSVYIARVCSSKKTPPWSSRMWRIWSTRRSTQPRKTRTNGVQGRELCKVLVPTCQSRTPKNTKFAPKVKWWLKTRFPSVPTLLPAPKAVTSNNGQHQLPRALGSVIRNVEATAPPLVGPAPSGLGRRHEDLGANSSLASLSDAHGLLQPSL